MATKRIQLAAIPPLIALLAMSVSLPDIAATTAHAAAATKILPQSTANCTSGAAIATENALATKAAVHALRQGGNAVDAAVASALVAGVVAPGSSGLGGGGFALFFDAHSGANKFLDFRETAPSGFDASALDVRPLADAERGRAVGVPGEPKGLYELQHRYGRLPFREVVQDAQRLAEKGFAIGPHLARVSRGLKNLEVRRELSGALGWPKSGLPAGFWLKVPGLSRTLKRYGEEGPNAIVDGAIAKELAQTAQAYGSAMSVTDLLSYAPIEREPLRMAFGQFVVVTAPPPSAGGILLLQTLGKFTAEELRAHRVSDERIHLLAEAYRQSLADRFAHVGDPAFVKVNVPGLLRPEYLASRRQAISLDRSDLSPVALPLEMGTSHLSIVDCDGNAVALTTTVNNAFGSKITAPTSQVLLNDELDDFGPKASPNAPRAGARPVSSMTPTMVFEGSELRFVIGGSGGMAISTNVTTTLLAAMVDGMTPRAAVEQPRFTIVPKTGELMLEEQFPTALDQRLGLRGEQVRRVARGISAVQFLARGAKGWQAAADSRKHGAAVSY